MKKRINKVAADLAREIWRIRGSCENCSKKYPEYQMQGAHMIGVGTAIRISSDLRNGFCLCSYCHRYFTDHPKEFAKFIEKSPQGKYYHTLMRIQNPITVGQKVDWEERVEFLKDIRRAIKAREMTIEEAREYEP
jgi:hypothetical protein